MSNRWKNICVVCHYNLKWEIDNRPDEYGTCTNCARVFCTDHEGIDWEHFICPKCNKENEEDEEE